MFRRRTASSVKAKEVLPLLAKREKESFHTITLLPNKHTSTTHETEANNIMSLLFIALQSIINKRNAVLLAIVICFAYSSWHARSSSAKFIMRNNENRKNNNINENNQKNTTNTNNNNYSRVISVSSLSSLHPSFTDVTTSKNDFVAVAAADPKKIMPSTSLRDIRDDNIMSCFEPMKKPILGVHDNSRILNMGFPKCGSTSLAKLFESKPFSSSQNNKKKKIRTTHNHCTTKREIPDVTDCGICFKRNQDRKKMPMLDNCGNFTVITQMDYTARNQCIFPQIQFMKELYEESPNATWILPFRNVQDWVRSLTNWYSGHSYSFRDRIGMWCDFPELQFFSSRNKKKSDKEYYQLFCNHVIQVREFVKKNPSLSLVEFSIEDPNAGEFLESVFPGIVDSNDWTHENKNKNLEAKNT